MRRRKSIEMKKKKIIDTFWFLLSFLLLFFSLFVSFCFGSLGFFEAGRVSPASFSFILGVGELFLACYPLVMSADWRSADGSNVTAGLDVCKRGRRGGYLLEMRLLGSSSSSSPLSSCTASSGMACIWTPGAWGSMRRFSNRRCLEDQRQDVFRNIPADGGQQQRCRQALRVCHQSH